MAKRTVLGIGAVAAFTAVTIPVASTFAENESKLDINYNVTDNLSLTLSSGEAIVVDGSTAPTTTATVAGNSVYNLVVIDQDEDSAMTNGTGGRIEAVDNTQNPTGVSTLTAGTWGIKTAITAGQGTTTLDSTKYYGVPARTTTTNQETSEVEDTSVPLTLMSRESLTDAGIAGDIATITYGVQKKTTQAAGTYNDTIVYTVSPMVVPDAYYYKLTGVSPSGPISTEAGTAVTVTSDIPSTSTVSGVTMKLKQSNGSTEYTCTNPTATVEGGFYKFTCATPSTNAGTYDIAINLTIDETTLTMTKANAITIAVTANIPWMYPTKVLTTGTSDKLVIATNNNTGSTVTTTTVTVGDKSCVNATSVKDASGRWIVTCDTPANLSGNQDVTAIMNISGNAYVYNGKSINYTTDTINNRLTAVPELAMQNINQIDASGPDSNKTFCANSTTPKLGDAVELVPTATLTDKRDGQAYTVRKLADGNCWMTENLRYGSTTNNEKRAYRSSDRTLSNNIDAAKMANLTDANISLGSASDKCDGYPSSGNSTPKICITDANTENNYELNNGKYGVLYNYCAATGGTVCNTSSMSTDAPGSICPANWKLPAMDGNPSDSDSTATATKDGTVKSLNNLLNNYNINHKETSSSEYVKLTTNSLDFVRAGFAYNGLLNGRSAYGDYWASTAYSSSNLAYALYFGSGNVYRDDYGRRYDGYSVRCVAS